MPKPWARRATALPMRPMPTMPRVLPLTLWPSMPVTVRPFQAPLRTRRSASAKRRQAAMTSPKARSAVSSVTAPGVLLISMPRAASAFTSIISTAAP